MNYRNGNRPPKKKTDDFLRYTGCFGTVRGTRPTLHGKLIGFLLNPKKLPKNTCGIKIPNQIAMIISNSQKLSYF